MFENTCFRPENQPLVSILVDNYNYARFLPESLASCLKQTYTNYELIIVDDGSADESREIIRAFAAQNAHKGFPIKTIFQENGGQTAAFNTGFAHANGDIICFLDSDDVWFSDKLEKVVTAHLTSGCHIVHHVETVDPAANPYLSGFTKTRGNPKPYARVRTDVNWHEALMTYGYMCHHSSCSSMSYSKEILEQIFPMVYPEEMRFCSDTVVFTCCLSLAPMYKLDEVLSYYRIHESNIYAGKYSGARDAALTLKIRDYCNKQLLTKNLPAIEFHPTRYFEHLLSGFLHSDCPACVARPVRGSSDKPLAIYGTASVGTAFYEILSKKGVPVDFFIDSDPSKQGGVFLGLPVISPGEIKPRGAFVLIASWASRDIADTLQSLDLTAGKDYVTFAI